MMRVVRRLLVAMVVLIVMLVIGDRVAAWAAQQQLAEQVAGELATYQVESAPPEASIGGFPFLTQVAAGEYERITLRLRNVGSGSLRLPAVELTASGVTAAPETLVNREGPIHARQVVGRATVGYEQVRVLTGWDALVLAPADDGALTVRLPVELLGVPLTLTGTAAVEPAGNAIRIRVADLTVVEPTGLPAGAGPLVEQIARDLSVDVQLPPLPYGLSVDSVRAEATGLVVGVSAQDVALSS
jgi:hypothetical protein